MANVVWGKEFLENGPIVLVHFFRPTLHQSFVRLYVGHYSSPFLFHDGNNLDGVLKFV